MSDEQREHGRDASASTEGPRTDQHPVPSHSGAAGPEASPAPGPVPGPSAGQAPAGASRPPYTGTPYPGGTPYGGAPLGGVPYGGAPYGSAHGSAHGSAPYGSTAVIEKPRKQQRTMKGIVAAALIAGLVGGGAGFGGAYALLGNDSGGGTQLTSAPATSNASNVVAGSVAAAAQKAMPSTVDIRVSMAQGSAEGSGVILTADGNVLTNNHVVAGSTGGITVTLADGSQHQATIVGTSPSYDLAVIKLQGVSGLTPATLGRSSDVQVGQQVVAIGSPQGLTGTVTTGIVSAFDRTVAVQGDNGSAVVYNGLQTDAPINQGNSGGPLVNLDGQVVGINSAIATGSSQSTGSIGLGFAIPVDQAKRVAQELMDSGVAAKPVLGVQGSAGAGGTEGAQIAAVQQGSPAAQAGLVAGDIVTKVGDARVQDFSDLIARVGANAPGQKVTLTVTSGGSERTVDVTLGSQPDRAASTDTGGESTTPFGNRSPFGQSPFGGGN